MAKWGEGDPRWHVEHREDGKNVNAWHWEESSKLAWSKNRLSELLTGLTDETAEGHRVVITGIKDVTGEASVTKRKGVKKLALFDLHVTLNYEGRVPASEALVKGEIKIEEFSSGADVEDYVFTVTVVGTGSEQDECKRMAEKMKSVVLAKLEEFVLDINEQ